MSEEWLVITLLFLVFPFLMILGLPIAFAIALASLAALMTVIPADAALLLISQKLATGMDSFTLLAIPFFILAGNIMSTGGVARRMIDFAELLTGRLPGSLTHCNILANMMFGALSGSAVASAAAVGGVVAPIQKKQGYDPSFCAAANISSCTSGLLIPPSNTLIIYSLVSGGTSITALFLAGYLPGLLMGLSIMLVSGIIGYLRQYPKAAKPDKQQIIETIFRAAPSLLLILCIMGGILCGIFTPTEASAIAVIYTLILSIGIYRELSIRQLPAIFLQSAITTSIIMLLIGASMGMSWVMTLIDIPNITADFLTGISSNPIIILLLINLILLIMGIFMDMTPALLIFTPVFLPIVTEMGMNPIHFGVMITFNLCIGICTPPVGSALFIGSSVANVPVHQILKNIMPFYVVLIGVLLAVTFIPSLSLYIPARFGY